MLVLKNRFIFLCTPRTGSRAIVNALKTLGDAKESREHHVHPEDVKSTAESLFSGSGDLPMVTIIRDPYDQTLSWFGHAVLRHEPEKHTEKDFADFIKSRSIGWYFHDKLNPYLGGETHVHAERFRRSGLQLTLSNLLGHVNSRTGTRMTAPKLSRVGGGFSPKRTLLTEKTRSLIEARFPEDIRLWNSLRERD